MRVPFALKRFVLTVLFMTVVIGGSLTLIQMRQQASAHKQRQLYHTLAARTLAGHLAGCRAHADAEEREARIIRAKKPVSPDDEARARDLLLNARWWRENAAVTSKQLDYHLDLAAKYARLTSAPWKAVTPDPPVPPRWNGRLPSQPESSPTLEAKPRDDKTDPAPETTAGD